MCSRLYRSTHLPEPSPKLFYRVLANGTGWYWEIVDTDNEVVDRGIADGEVRARADALEAAFDRLHVAPELYPERRKCRRLPKH